MTGCARGKEYYSPLWYSASAGFYFLFLFLTLWDSRLVSGGGLLSHRGIIHYNLDIEPANQNRRR